MRIIKKFLNVHFRFFTNEMECEKGKQDFSKKVTVLNAINVLIFQYKNAKKTSFKKYTIGLFQRQISDGNRYVLLENQNLKGS